MTWWMLALEHLGALCGTCLGRFREAAYRERPGPDDKPALSGAWRRRAREALKAVTPYASAIAGTVRLGRTGLSPAVFRNTGIIAATPSVNA